MSPPLDRLREQLNGSPREYEYLDVRADELSATERTTAIEWLLEAGRRGDARVPEALRILVGTRAYADPRLDELLTHGADAVRIEAGWSMATDLRDHIARIVESQLAARRLDDHALKRGLDLMLTLGDDVRVRALLEGPNHDTRVVVAGRLWEARHLDLFPSAWWAGGLALLRCRLSIPLPSFLDPAIREFKQLLDADPSVLGYTPSLETELPPQVRAAVMDIEKGTSEGAPAAILDALTDVQREAIVVTAAARALSAFRPRGVRYVAWLSGQAHRDLFDWATGSGNAALVAAGKAAFSGVPRS